MKDLTLAQAQELRENGDISITQFLAIKTKLEKPARDQEKQEEIRQHNERIISENQKETRDFYNKMKDQGLAHFAGKNTHKNFTLNK